MMENKVAVCMTHGHTAKWLQVVMNSMKERRNETPNDVYVACSWPNHPSIKAISETELGEGVTLVECKKRLHSHATGLEEILDVIANKGYKYMFCTETDCRAMKDGWLDWFVNFLEQDEKLGIAGFFWHEGSNHFNINPSGTLYGMDMLLQYHKEVYENDEDIFWHPRGNRMGTDAGMDPTIRNVVGVFAETRGIKNPTPEQEKVILSGVPQAAWFEPGQWLYARLQGEWREVKVPCDHIYMQYPGHTAPEGTYYGGKADPWLVHLWGGTRAYDWKKHPVTDNFVKSCAPAWLAREDKIWKETVPEKYRSIVQEINKEENIEQKMIDNLGFIIPEAF